MSNEIVFVNGKSKCGCIIEFSDGGGEYSDVHTITPCAEHSCPETALLQRIADLETQKADLLENVLNGYEASALTMTLRKTVGYLPDYLRFCGIYGVDHDAIIDKLDFQSFVLARVINEDLRQDIVAGTGKEEQA
ncbi:hypothetical protein NJK71_000353 [Salmonella enterica]|nr:hypothetical protein [Salmonella enterica]